MKILCSLALAAFWLLGASDAHAQIVAYSCDAYPPSGACWALAYAAGDVSVYSEGSGTCAGGADFVTSNASASAGDFDNEADAWSSTHSTGNGTVSEGFAEVPADVESDDEIAEADCFANSSVANFYYGMYVNVSAYADGT